MPQKKNPDLAELIRGKTGRIYGNYINLATTMKSLPLSYNRDLQEDKEPLVDSFLTYGDSLDIMSSMLQSAQFNVNRFEDEMEGDFSLATDLADWLVLKGVPFREAHRIVGKVVKMLEDAGRNFKEIKTGELKKIDEIFDETALAVLNIKTALERKKTFGSPNPDIVLERIIFWKKELNISN
jgi:argininosuccinate lyase